MFHFLLFRPSEPARGMVEDDARVESLDLSDDLLESIHGSGDVSGDVVDYHMDCLDLVLEECCSWDCGADGLFQLGERIENSIRGGVLLQRSAECFGYA